MKPAPARIALLTVLVGLAPWIAMPDGLSPGCAPAFGAAGVLDPTFGSGGLTLVPLDGEGNFASVLQPDGKLVSVGNVQLYPNRQLVAVRYDPDGALDGTFGTGGVSTIGPEVGDPQPRDVVVLPDGKLLIAATVRIAPGTYTRALVRLAADGSLDTGFGTGGIVAPDGGGIEVLAVLPDGRILAGGSVAGGPGNTSDFAVRRFDAEGHLDGQFGEDGIARADLTSYDLVTSLVVEPDGSILAAGQTTIGFGGGFGLARWLADGSPDPSFGVGGTVLLTQLATGSFDYAADLLELPSGSRAAVGRTSTSGSSDFTVAVVDHSGGLDPAFSGDGRATFGFGVADVAFAGASEPDGRIVIAGYSALVEGGLGGSNDDLRPVLVRLLPGGAPDPTFGVGGLVRLDLPEMYNGDYDAVVRLADGRLLAAGVVNFWSAGSAWVVARYLNGVCGNGTIEPGEECDDGNVLGGDCCSSACQFESAGSVCADDGLRCTLDRCDGAGSCGHSPGIRSSCRSSTAPGAARLRIRDRAAPSGDRLSWRWTRGTAVGAGELLEPAIPVPYTLCGFDASANEVVFEATAPGGVTCSGHPCWAFTPGFAVRYRQPDGAPDGIVDLQLEPGSAGRSRASVTARGQRLQLPSLPLPGSFLVQLQAGSGGICFEARYSPDGVRVSRPGRFEARSD